jgi:hypothetical protein
MRMTRAKKAFQAEDLVCIPSEKGMFYLGHVAEDVREEIGAVLLVVYDIAASTQEELSKIDPARLSVISMSLVTPELLERGVWKVIDRGMRLDYPYREMLRVLRENQFVGAVIIGAGLAAEYLDTYYGYMDASIWPDLNYVRDFFESKRLKAE